MKHRLQALLFAAHVFPALVFATGNPWSADLKGTIGHNTNIGNAERHRDTIDDNFGELSGGVSYTHGFGPQSLTARGFAEAESWENTEDLTRLTAGAQLIYRRQLGSLPSSPSISLMLNGQVDSYDVNQRDSTIGTATFSISKPVGTTANLSAGAEYFYRDSEGSVWDLDHVRGFLGGSIGFLKGWSTYANYSFLKGDVASTAQTRFSDGTIPTDIFGLIDVAKAIEPDDAFNNEYGSGQRRWTAYRLSAISHAGRIGVKKQFSSNIILDVSAFSVWVNAKADNEYDTQVYQASLIKRF